MNDIRYNTNRREREDDIAALLWEDGGDNREQRGRLLRNLRRAWEKELSPCQRRTLDMYYRQNMTVIQIAAAQEVAPSTVSRTLRRGRERLRRYLQYSL